MMTNLINQDGIKYTNLFRNSFINNGISNIHIHQVSIYNSHSDVIFLN